MEVNGNNQGLMVSIRCTAFNHAPFIRQCLEGFVKQITNFRFEAIVHDDCSTDNTVSIIKEYELKYPDIIKPIYETENQYSKKNGSLRRIMDGHCLGKYVAMCEADDYWTDPYKLQKQVDFLESHPDYTLCFHGVKEVYEDNHSLDRVRANIEDRDYSGVEWYQQRPSQFASFVIRRDILDSEMYKRVLNMNLPVGDIPLLLTCAYYGKIRGMADVMSVYRRHTGGWTTQLKSIDSLINIAESHLNYAVFGEEIKKQAVYFYQKECINHFLNLMANGRGFNWVFLRMSFKQSIRGSLVAAFDIIREIIVSSYTRLAARLKQ